MKRKGSHHRPMPSLFVRPIADHQPNLPQAFSVNRQPAVHGKKIFIIKQTSRLSATNAAAGKTVRRILIFDNHPDSLRLVFEGDANPHVDLSALPSIRSWELILASILTMAALIGMFWPLL